MEKKGLIGMIVLVVIGSLIVLGIGAGVYFYNFFVFKEIRTCVGDWEDTSFPCETKEDCLAGLTFENEIIDNAPDFVRENFEDIVDAVVYCEENCYVGQVRGVDYETGELLELDGCDDGEEEFVMEIRGKEGLKILKWLKLNKN